MPTLVCPNCKHKILTEEREGVCPSCGWNLQTRFEKTLETGSSENPGNTSDDDADFLVPGAKHPNELEATLTDTAASIDSPTLQRPTESDKSQAAADVELTLPAGENKTTPPAQPQDFDPHLMNTLPSAKPESKASKTSHDNDPTIVLPAGGSPSRPTVQRSVKTVIPPRSISRKSEPGKLQDYKLEKRIGSGSFGTVYRALQVPLDRTVALKVLTAESGTTEQQERVKTEFLREAQFTGRLEHPNIVPIHDIGLTEDSSGDPNRPFYVMKEIHGVSWLQQIMRLSRGENLEIFKRVVDAIGFAHDKNVLHCDLKPENVMLGEFGEVLVVDWGQAIDLSQPASIRPGGTPAYISPEMAQFWCDIYLDKQDSSPAQASVGKRSDVYLLGAILFEIVTGGLPRNADDGETQYDVIRRACENNIVEHDEFLNDELMQIARRALRLPQSDHIETINQLQTAIRDFETRALSIELRERADQLLAAAKVGRSYDDFQKSRFGYEEAIEKWHENKGAKQGLLDARLSCAELALQDQNFDLGIEMLAEPESEAETLVKERLLAGRKRRDRRKKLVRWLALGLVASIIVGIGLNAFMINLNLKSAKLRDEALQDKANIEQEIEPLRLEVAANQTKIKQFPIKLKQEQDRFDAELAKQRAQLNAELAEEKQKFGDELAQQKRQFANRLAEEKSRLAEQLKEFDEQRASLNSEIGALHGQLSSLNESSKLLRFKSAISDIRQELDSGNFREARQLLDGLEPKNTWEWSRLNLLSHREVESLFPKHPVTAVCASLDGRKLGIVFPDRIELRETGDFLAPPALIPLANVQSAAFSPDGMLLALGRPSNSLLEPGLIQIVDVSDARNPRLARSLQGQSKSIFHMEFSPQSNRFLAVGVPSNLRKGSGSDLEEELQVWSSDWKRIDVKLVDAQGARPKFERASFSVDGSRILTTHPSGLGREQFVHLFSESSEGYRWIEKSPVVHLNCATFLDDSGTEIIASARNPKTGAFELVVWDPERSIATAADNEQQNLVSVGNVDLQTSLSAIAQLDGKILHMWRAGKWLVTCGEDRQSTLWNLGTGSATSFRGHSRSVDFCSLRPGPSENEHVIVSAAIGSNSELLKTNLATYLQENDTLAIGKTADDDNPSPTCLFRSSVTGRLAFANDQGLAAVVMDVDGPENSLTQQVSEGKTIQWEVSAWKNQVLTSEYLFAQSRLDEFYQFDRRSGELVQVLTTLAENRDDQTEITAFEVSADGRMAIVTTNEKLPQFEIWNLETQQKTHTINYGDAGIFGDNARKELPTVQISPDGKWVVAGKLGLFAWSTATGRQHRLNQPAADVARTSLNTIRFLPGTSKFLASWQGRVDLFDLVGQAPARRFNWPQLSYNKTEPNIVDAVVKQGRVLLLARWTASSTNEAGIALLEFGSDRPLKIFPQAKFACFSQAHENDVLVVTESENASQLTRYNRDSGQTAPIDLQLDAVTKRRFRSLQGITEFADGAIVAQSLTPNPLNPVRRNWNTVSCNQDLTAGRLRVFAKPQVDYCAIAGDMAITLDEGNLRFWNVTSKGVHPAGVFDQNCLKCELAPDENQLAIIPFSKDRILIINPANRQLISTISPKNISSLTSLTWSQDSRKLAVGDAAGSVQLWRRENGADEFLNYATIAAQPVEMSPVTGLALSQDTTTVLSILGQKGVARITRLVDENWTSFLLQSEDGQKLIRGDISPDGRRVATGSEFGQLTIWNSEDLRAGEKPGQQSQVSAFEREIMNLRDQASIPHSICQIPAGRCWPVGTRFGRRRRRRQ